MDDYKKIDMLKDFIEMNIDDNLANIALTCSSYADKNNSISQDSLAIVGDHVIKLLISSNSFLKDIKISRDKLHNLVNEKGTNKNLEDIAIQRNIDVFLYNYNTDLDGSKKRATSIEAIFGAIFLSNGIESAIKFAKKIELID